MSDAFHDSLPAVHAEALWERPPRHNTPPPEAAHLWRWHELDPLLDAATAATDMNTAERRVLVLSNPAYDARTARAPA